MIEIGRIVIKLAGRDAGREAIIVDILDGNYVLIDGNVRRRKCNILHLEPTDKKIEIKKGASHEDVKKEFEKLKIEVWDTKKKEKTERPRKVRGKKKAVEEEIKKGKKKETKKEKPAKKKVAKEEKEDEGVKEAAVVKKEAKPEKIKKEKPAKKEAEK